jgi:hypothetical protein
VAVAAKHYLQVTDEHFRRALEAPKIAVQNPVQYVQETACKARKQETQNPGFSGVCEAMPFCTNGQVGDEGLEPPTSTV